MTTRSEPARPRTTITSASARRLTCLATLAALAALLSCQSDRGSHPGAGQQSVASVSTNATSASPVPAAKPPPPDAVTSDGPQPKFAPGECGRAKKDNYVWMIARIEGDRYIAHGWQQCGWGDPAKMPIDTIDSLYLKMECPSVAEASPHTTPTTLRQSA
jgi:hypothetical protein